jgi:hypothetical protein
VVLYGYETWSLTFMEEYRLRVFENRVLRRTFGPRSDEVRGGCRKLHNEELHDLYGDTLPSPNSPSSRHAISTWTSLLLTSGNNKG